MAHWSYPALSCPLDTNYPSPLYSLGCGRILLVLPVKGCHTGEVLLNGAVSLQVCSETMPPLVHLVLSLASRNCESGTACNVHIVQYLCSVGGRRDMWCAEWGCGSQCVGRARGKLRR